MFYVFIFLGFLIRLLLIPSPGFKADIAFWKGWGLAGADNGVTWLVKNTNYNYPPGFAYVLSAIDKTYALFKNPYNLNEFWLDTNLLYLFLLKSLTIAADLLIVFLVIKIAKRVGSRWGIAAALFYFLNPATIFDGVIWGQVDQIGLALFLTSVYFLFEEKPPLAAVFFALSCLLKFQNIIFIPIFYLFLFKKYSFEEVVRALMLSFGTFLLIVAPFFIGKEMESLVRLLTVNADYFPFYSLNAFNIWWIASSAAGMAVSDKNLVLGITSAKTLSLLLFSFFYLVAFLTLLFSRKEALFKNLILSCSLTVFSFFHLLTQSHERYLFPLVGLLLVLALFDVEKRVAKTLGFYFIFSIFFFLNMYLSLGMHYADQVFLPFTSSSIKAATLYLSVFQILIFVFFVVYFFYPKILKHLFYLLLFATAEVVFLTYQNANYILKKPISLTSLDMISYEQDYLRPVYGKPVDSLTGPLRWGRLASNYYFYSQGIGSHANSKIVFRLKKKFSKFKTDYGVDVEGGEKAKVYFLVEGDGKTIFKSEKKGKFDDPSSVMIDIGGVDYLTLKIVSATDNISGAHADWLDPKLTR